MKRLKQSVKWLGRLSDWSIDGLQPSFEPAFLFCLEIVYLPSGIYCNPSRCLSRSSGDKSFSYAPIGLARIAPFLTQIGQNIGLLCTWGKVHIKKVKRSIIAIFSAVMPSTTLFCCYRNPAGSAIFDTYNEGRDNLYL